MDEIRSRLNNAEAVIVLWSAASIEKTYVLYEASIADGRNVLLSLHLSGFDPGSIPPPLVWRNSSRWDDLTRVTQALIGKGVTPSSGPRIVIPKDLRADLSVANPLLPDKLLVFLRKAYAAGFTADFQNSVILKADVPGKGMINFGGVTRQGKLETTRIGERVDNKNDLAIVSEHLDAVARLIPNAVVNKEKTPWTWRVEVNRQAPEALPVINPGDEWIEIMTTTRKRLSAKQPPSEQSPIARQSLFGRLFGSSKGNAKSS